jgi:beta-lactamase class A
LNREAIHPLNTIHQDIDRLIQPYPQATVAVALYDCQTSAEFLLRPHELFHPASTIKIGVMLEVYHQAGQGLLSLDDSIPILNEFTSLADGSPYSLSEEDDSEATLYRRLGQTVSLRELVFLMITQSSNFATNLLIQRVTAERATSFMRELGAEDVLVLRGLEDDRAFALGMNNVASAYGLMHLLKGLAEGRIVSHSASEEMIQVLLAQAFNEGIPAGLPGGMRVAHKTGWIPNIYHDAGIIFPEGRKPYCLVVLTKGIEDKLDQHALVAAISRECYNHLFTK